MTRPTFRSALAAERPLVTPLAHDALSARLIERAGFRAFAIGGSAMLAARYALPDLGIAALGEMADGIRDIAAATSLPFLADGDDGYGDAKSVAHTVRAYERLGVGAILIEDQRREGKQPRAEKARGVVDIPVMAQKLATALDARQSADTLIIGRTDAYGALGLDAAIARAERFLALGVDGVFVAGLRTAEEYARVARGHLRRRGHPLAHAARARRNGVRARELSGIARVPDRRHDARDACDASPACRRRRADVACRR